MASNHFGTKAQFLLPEQPVMHHLAVSMSAMAKSAGFRIPPHLAFASASIHALNFFDLHNALHHIELHCIALHVQPMRLC